MHNEIIRLKSSNEVISVYAYDDDEVNKDIEMSRLMDMLNDHGTVEQINAMEICKQRGWAIHKEFDPCHYYSNQYGYFYWFDTK
jgi:hypothetical protein